MQTIDTAGSPLVRGAGDDGGRSARRLARLAQRGEVVRLAPGTYVATRRWLLLPQHERLRVAIVAFSDSRRRPVTFCGTTALELLGYPVVERTPRIHVRAAHRGHARTSQQPSPYVNDQAVLRILADLGTRGMVTSHGTVPMLPAVRHHWNLPSAEVSGTEGSVAATGPPSLSSVGSPSGPPLAAHPGAYAGSASTPSTEVSVCLDDGTVLGRVRVDPLPAAMAAVFGHEPLNIGTPPADAIKREVPGAEAVSEQARELLRTAAQRTRFDAQWRFADARSESVGESLSRAVIHESGFVVPDLQWEVTSATGSSVARVDFYWEQISLAAEFDGLVKYTGRLARPGATGPVSQDALVREKQREDAIRRAGCGMARWVWADLFNRQRFVALLEQHGVPRRTT